MDMSGKGPGLASLLGEPSMEEVTWPELQHVCMGLWKGALGGRMKRLQRQLATWIVK